PGVAAAVGLQVVQGDEVGVLQVEALGDAAELDVGVPARHQLQRHLLAAVADPVVDLAEAAAADAALDRVAVQRPLSRTVGEPHLSPPRETLCRRSVAAPGERPAHFPPLALRSCQNFLYAAHCFLPSPQQGEGRKTAQAFPIRWPTNSTVRV